MSRGRGLTRKSPPSPSSPPLAPSAGSGKSSSGSHARSPRGGRFFSRPRSPAPTMQDSVARLSVPSSGGGSGGSLHQLLHVASPANRRVQYALTRTARRSAAAAEVAVRAASELRASSHGADDTDGGDAAFGSAPAPADALAEQVLRLEARAASSSLLHDSTHSTIAATEASAQRRRIGHTPGDRVDPSQLGKDVCRDVVFVEGERFAGAPTSALLARLAQRVMEVVENAITGGADPPEKRVSDVSRLLPWTAGVVGCASRLVNFCREVLLCTSRTVIGGDSFDALECVFRPSAELFRLQQVTQGDPIVLAVRMRPRGVSGSAATGRSCAEPEQLLAEVEVVASCAVRYRLIDVDAEAEAGSDGGGPREGGSGRGLGPDVPGHVATLLASFSRRLPWEAPAPSGSVAVEVEWLRGVVPAASDAPLG